MRKLLIVFFISTLFIANASAAPIALNTISTDSNAGTHNSNFVTIANLADGNIEGSTDSGATVANIKADSIFEINMADDANPRVRDSELLSVTTDSINSQNAYVYSGGVPATSANLTSNISACVAYVNGYRVSKGSTAHTYSANRDTWVDLSQTGVYTFTEVANGAAEPVVAANSARLAKVVTSGAAITSVTDEANRRLPGLIIPAQYRSGLFISRDSATTITIFPGTCEINNTMINKTSVTTLTLTTAGDWAGGASLAAANTSGYIGVDSSGNLKLHTTAPTHDNYAVSTTLGKKRYATWSSTVYRILGWFRMNAASQINPSDWGNIKEADVSNATISNDSNVVAYSTTSFNDAMEINYYSSGGQITLIGTISGDVGAAFDGLETRWTMDGNALTASGQSNGRDAASTGTIQTINEFLHTPSQGAHTYRLQAKNLDGDAFNYRHRVMIIRED